ncbi:hypothetical protein QBC35DRAFT_344582, partial [Podospora australis]
ICQKRKNTFTCGHPASTTIWHPQNVEDCNYAADANERDFLGNLKRCSGRDASTATTSTRGHCGAHYCMMKVYKDLGWQCHQCRHVTVGDDACAGADCTHQVCASC